MHNRSLIIIALLLLALAFYADAGRAQSPQPESGSSTTVETLMGTLPWQTAVVDSITEGATGRYISMDIYENTSKPYISYYDSTNQDLRLAHPVTAGTGNCGPRNDWLCEIIDGAGDVGQFSSIDVIYRYSFFRGYAKIGISYYDATNGALKYAAYTCALTCSWTIYEVDDDADSGDYMGQYSSIKFNSEGEPNIAYYYFDSGDFFSVEGVKYAYYAGSSAGNCGDGSNWDCTTVEAALWSLGKHISIDLNYDDAVQIAYYDGYNGDLRYAWYAGIGNCGTGNTWYCQIIDSGESDADVGKFASLHAADSASDFLRVAYYDSTNGKIKYAVQAGSGGNCTNTAFNCFGVDTVGAEMIQVGLSISVDEEESPIIAYMDASDEFSASRLKVARPSPRMGELIGNCGDVPPGYLFMYWWCETIDRGYQDIVSEAAYAAVGVSPTGLGAVAYYEHDDYYYEGRLKVATQFYRWYLPHTHK